MTAVDILRQEKTKLEQRLDRGLDILRQATGCSDEHAELLLQRWAGLSEEYGRVVTALEEITGYRE